MRKYNGKLLIKPARQNVQSFLRDIRKTIRKHPGMSAVSMIGQLNPKIRGRANYHRHVVSGKAFSYIDTCIWNSLWQWMKRRHRNKSTAWLKRKYWSNGSRPSMFSTRVKDKRGILRLYEVIRASHIGAARHVKIRGDANPFDPKYDKYFAQRRLAKKSGQRRRFAESFG